MQNMDCDICGCIVDNESLLHCPTCPTVFHSSCISQHIMVCGNCTQKTCSICNNSNGLMIESLQRVYHPLCQFFFIQSKNQLKFKTRKKTVQKISDSFMDNCIICQNKGAFMVCLYKGCQLTIHPYCLLKSKHKKTLHMPQIDEDNGQFECLNEMSYQALLRLVITLQSIKDNTADQIATCLLNDLIQIKKINPDRSFRFKCPKHLSEPDEQQSIQFLPQPQIDLSEQNVLKNLINQGMPSLYELLNLYKNTERSFYKEVQHQQVQKLVPLWFMGLGFQLFYHIQHPELIKQLKYRLVGKNYLNILKDLDRFKYEELLNILEFTFIIKRDKKLFAFIQLMKNVQDLLKSIGGQQNLFLSEKRELSFLKAYLPSQLQYICEKPLRDNFQDQIIDKLKEISIFNHSLRTKYIYLKTEQVRSLMEPNLISMTLMDFILRQDLIKSSFFTSYVINVPHYLIVLSVYLSDVKNPIARELYSDFTSFKESVLLFPRCFAGHWNLTAFINFNRVDLVKRILVFNSYYPSYEEPLKMQTQWMLEFIKENISNRDPLKYKKLSALNDVTIQYCLLPHQMNDYDCGIATIECALSILLEPNSFLQNEITLKYWPPDGYYVIIRSLLLELMMDLQILKNVSKELHFMIAQEYGKKFLRKRQILLEKYRNPFNKQFQQLQLSKNSGIYEYIYQLLIIPDSINQQQQYDLCSIQKNWTFFENENSSDSSVNQESNQKWDNIWYQKKQEKNAFVSVDMIKEGCKIYNLQKQQRLPQNQASIQLKNGQKKQLSEAKLFNYIYIDGYSQDIDLKLFRLDIVNNLNYQFEIVLMSSGLKQSLRIQDVRRLYILVGRTSPDKIPEQIQQEYHSFIEQGGYQTSRYYMVKRGIQIDNF